MTKIYLSTFVVCLFLATTWPAQAQSIGRKKVVQSARKTKRVSKRIRRNAKQAALQCIVELTYVTVKHMEYRCRQYTCVPVPGPCQRVCNRPDWVVTKSFNKILKETLISCLLD